MKIFYLFLLFFIFFNSLFSNDKNSSCDLSPAKWVWYPSERTLQNTFILFRKEVDLAAQPKSAKGWIFADSRYALYVNGQRIQWGPAPSDPRWQEVDNVDLAKYLKKGKNVIGVQVLHYGVGEGSWATGKPGFIFNLDIDSKKIISDETWSSYLARSWKPGQYKRWFLRTLQEEFDARIFPYGWSTEAFATNAEWFPAKCLRGSPEKPSICTDYDEYQSDTGIDCPEAELRERSIPLMKEYPVFSKRLAADFFLKWNKDVTTYFDMKTPEAYQYVEKPCATPNGIDAWSVSSAGDGMSSVLTFEMPEQIVGWPFFEIETQEDGVTVELLTQEGHDIAGKYPLLNTHFNSWSRFICKRGVNRFQTFDFESLKWLQLNIRNFKKDVVVRNIGVLRRVYDWPLLPHISLSDKALEKLMEANVNTILNSSQEIVADGMGRERQQYSGDGGHQLHITHLAFGDSRLHKRFIITWSQGLTRDGYFLDCWPSYDRLARVMQRQVDMTRWGPLLDHGVGFCFDNFYYWQYTKDKTPFAETLPRLLKFFDYLKSIRSPEDNLLPVENLGVPWVWIDVPNFKKQRHKQLAFNLYASAMCKYALAPLCENLGVDKKKVEEIKIFGDTLEKASVKKFWSLDRRIFVDNLPWEKEEGEIRLSDRSVATSVIFNQCPNGEVEASIKFLENPPKDMLSYPCNAPWRLWALAKAGKIDTILQHLRKDWATMPSVVQNNTLQENWIALPDSNSQWSHCAVSPLLMLYQAIGGVSPLEDGWTKVQIKPQFGDLTAFAFDVQSINGAITLKWENEKFSVKLPPNISAEVVLDPAFQTNLPVIRREDGKIAYRLDRGGSVVAYIKK